jgi:hypothetical protein
MRARESFEGDKGSVKIYEEGQEHPRYMMLHGERGDYHTNNSHEGRYWIAFRIEEEHIGNPFIQLSWSGDSALRDYADRSGEGALALYYDCDSGARARFRSESAAPPVLQGFNMSETSGPYSRLVNLAPQCEGGDESGTAYLSIHEELIHGAYDWEPLSGGRGAEFTLHVGRTL